MSILHTWLTLIGKYWKTHQEIFPKFQFSGVLHRRISGKLIQDFSEIKISGHELDQFLVKSSTWMSFPEIGLAYAPEIRISKKKVDEFSRNPSLSYPGELKFRKNG